MEAIVSGILFFIGGYLLLGLLFSIIFLWKGLGKVDGNAKGTPLFFKLLLFPGMTVLWVVFLRKWLKARAL